MSTSAYVANIITRWVCARTHPPTRNTPTPIHTARTLSKSLVLRPSAVETVLPCIGSHCQHTVHPISCTARMCRGRCCSICWVWIGQRIDARSQQITTLCIGTWKRPISRVRAKQKQRTSDQHRSGRRLAQVRKTPNDLVRNAKAARRLEALGFCRDRENLC